MQQPAADGRGLGTRSTYKEVRPRSTNMTQIVIVVALLAVHSSSAAAQFTPRPYNAAAVHRTAEEAIQLIDDLTHGRVHPVDESGLGDLAQFLVESLMLIDSKAPIDPLALDALAAVSGNGFPGWALTDLGDRSVPSLIKSVKTTGGLREHQKGAMDALERMFERPTIEASLSGESKRAIRQLAQEQLLSAKLVDQELGAAGYLALATRDPALRTIASQLLQPKELRRRGLDPAYDNWTIEVIGQALEKFPPR